MKKLLLALTVSIFLLAGCGDSSGGNQEVYTKAGGEIESMNPTATTFTDSSAAIDKAYSTLYQIDQNSELVPDMAADLPEISDDGMTYTIKLVEDRKWLDSEGNEMAGVTAQDFITAWEAGLNGEYAFIFQDFTTDDGLNVKALDDYTLEIKLNYVAPYFTELLALQMFSPVPTDFFNEQGDNYGTTLETTYSNGAYYLSYMDISTKLAFTRSDQPGIVYNNDIKTIDVPTITDPDALYNSFLGGDIDVAAVPAAHYEDVKDDSNVYQTPKASVFFLNYNVRGGNSGYMDNVNFRKALNYSLDRESLANDVLKKGIPPYYNLVPKGLTESSEVGDYATNYTEDYTSYDPDAAQEEMEKFLEDENVAKEDISLDLVMSDSGTNAPISEKVKNDVESNLGITVNIRLLPTDSYYTAGDEGDFDMLFSGWSADYADPTNYLGIFTTESSKSGVGSTGFENADYDELYEKTLAEADLDKRYTLAAETEKMLLEDQAVIMPLFQNVLTEANNDENLEYKDHSYQVIGVNYLNPGPDATASSEEKTDESEE